MEAAEELASGSKEQTHIVKGKRTKRVRPQSPIPFSITGNSPNHCHGEAQDDSNNGDEDDKSSPATTTRHRHSTEEEEDMANCLILLAQGKSRESPKAAVGEDGMNYTKYSSRRFMEATSLGSGKAGFYVYECRTCNRTFPSFQALGGHRTSHKKPKAMAAFTAAIDNDKKQLLFMSDEDEFQLKNNNCSNPFSLQLNRGNLCSNNSNKPKVHECSVCGAEFTSGQALGGHMRRHRTPIGTNTMLSLIPMALEQEEEQQQPRKRRNVLPLDLDLNLPAPEDDQTESKFAFASKQQEQHKQQQKEHQQHQANLIFTAPALVDCHN